MKRKVKHKDNSKKIKAWVKWLKSPEAKANFAKTFKETEIAIAKYRELQRVDYRTLQIPTTI